MKNILIILILMIFSLTACSTESPKSNIQTDLAQTKALEAAVQTAIAQTQIAYPTKTTSALP
ncbi:MAG: hypothetical protein PVG14_17740 [Anaerolineales bacterium]|jgi:hypothetical protein